MPAKTKNKAKGQKKLTAALSFVVFILLLRIIYLPYKSFQYLSADMLENMLVMFGVLEALLYIIAVIGIMKRRQFGIQIAVFTIFLDGLGSLSSPPVGVFSFLFAVFLIYLLWMNQDYFRDFDQTDKSVWVVALLLITVYGLSFWYVLNFDEEEYVAGVIKEAIEKGDVGVCDKLGKSFLMNNCVKSFAVNNKNADLCDKINSNNVRDLCYFDIGIELNSRELCDKIQNGYEQGLCHGALKE
ncbi:MAG: hypothetical protein MSIBF_06995 [Candidatus Altiarchaeales archaeon IMC4]|nr:MAG: hypothetical protein MSIBF_06995 [Candidatus Altiarchaeales archaeon IMC4]